ncbi:exocyst complex component SEC15B [Amborella trichopoda]|uniref:Exocyst complex component n=1 Tax=Amborella trichopoda TaxID=13333 RepID=W1NX03_AMBTC|nr:exocyst complex component SEC15B [Amborella trichopoda]ERN02152.1 hypothetical protein AMTR_s00045p00185750 [Amborella trichopoda]|eukprot:XP_006840477.1 exocyst complex component SEC15B [Amborella trichopoda]
MKPPKSSAQEAAAGAGASYEDQLVSAIGNGEDLGPIVRMAFAANESDALLSSLRNLSRAKDGEIQALCYSHHSHFILAVDHLRSLLSDALSLKSSLSSLHSNLQSSASPLLESVQNLLEALNLSQNLGIALTNAGQCLAISRLCVHANAHLANRRHHQALVCLRILEAEHLGSTPCTPLGLMLQTHIPAIRDHIRQKAQQSLGDWLVEVRSTGRELGQLAISGAASARQRAEEIRQEPYALDIDDNPEPDPCASLDLTPLYRAHHVHKTLGLEAEFRHYYHENRRLQLVSDFQLSNMGPFLESHQAFFSQIAGFFIVEDRVQGVVGRAQDDALWDLALAKVCDVVDEQFSRMQAASHLLLVKDHASLMAETLGQSGFYVRPLFEALARHAERYHELLLRECGQQAREAVAAEELEPMVMRKAYEYDMNIVSFGLETICTTTPAFPYVAPFSAAVPACCRVVRSFIEDSVSYLAHAGLDWCERHRLVRVYLDRLLCGVLNEALLACSPATVSHAVQAVADVAALSHAFEHFEELAARLSGVITRRNTSKVAPLTPAMEKAEATLLSLLCTKLDEYIAMMETVNWVADEPPKGGNQYANEAIIYLETLVSTAGQVLPPEMLSRALKGALSHISEGIVAFLGSDAVRRFNGNAVAGLDADLRLLEGFAEGQGSEELKQGLAEARQMVNLLLSNHPENFLNPVIREKSYATLDYRKVVAISEKMRDSGAERLFGSFGTRGAKQNPKKKSLDVLIRRLKDAA